MIAAFLMVTVDGYHEGRDGAFDFWNVDADDFEQWSVDQLDRADILVFGRKTFEGMADYWPTSQAHVDSPRIALRMNTTPKVVVSRTLESTDWDPTTIVHSIDLLRSLDGDALVLGSSELVASIAQAGALDELRLMVNPVAIAGGGAALNTLTRRLPLDLRDVVRFGSGNVLLTYGIVAERPSGIEGLSPSGTGSA